MPQIADLYASLRVEGAGKFTSTINAATAKVKQAQGLFAGLKAKINSAVLKTFGEKKLSGDEKVLGKAFDNMSASVKQFADKAKFAFAGLVGLVGGTVAMGDWKTFQDLKVALQLLGRTAGVILSPIVKELTGYIQKLALWLNSLSPAQQAQIVFWTKIGLVLTGVVTILPKVISALSLLSSTIGNLGAAGRLGVAAVAGVAIGNYLGDKLTKGAQEGIDKHANEAVNKAQGNLTEKDLESKTAKGILGAGSKEEQLAKAKEEVERLGKEQQDLQDMYNTQSKFNPGAAGLAFLGNTVGGGYLSDLTGIGGGKYKTEDIHRGMDSIMGNATGLGVGEMLKSKQDEYATAKGILNQLEAGKDVGANAKEGKNKGKSPAEIAKQNYLEEIAKPTQLMGIMDAWKNAMQSNVETPEIRMQREMLKKFDELITATQKNKPDSPVGSAA